jgi:hypothetical protein
MNKFRMHSANAESNRFTAGRLCFVSDGVVRFAPQQEDSSIGHTCSEDAVTLHSTLLFGIESALRKR